MTLDTATATSHQVTMSSHQLARVLGNGITATGKDMARAALCCVQLTFSRSAGVETLQVRATDSYWLISETIETGTGSTEADGTWSVVLLASALAPVVKAAKDRSMEFMPASIEIVGDAVTFRLDAATFVLRSEPVSYPAIEQLITTFKAGEIGCVSISSVYLAKIAKVTPRTGKDLVSPVFVFSESDRKPLRAEWRKTDSLELFALVMPVRVD